VNQKVLVIFAKYPEAGKVKSRLAQKIGAVEAAIAYKKMVERVVRKTDPRPFIPSPEGRGIHYASPSLDGRGLGEGEYRRVLCFDPLEKENDFKKWFPLLEISPQRDGDLGQRMSAALQESLGRGSGHAVLIGTDCVDVDRSLILKAFQNLEKADLVLGPAKDGGYYLIGCKQVYPEIFTGIDWSTERVFSQTLEIAEKLKLRVAYLPELEDIDTEKQLWKIKNII